MNAKLKKTELFISIEDIGYKTADNIEGNYENAILLMEKDPSFPETISDDTRNKLTVGFHRKFRESRNGKVSYYLTLSTASNSMYHWIKWQKYQRKPKFSN